MKLLAYGAIVTRSIDFVSPTELALFVNFVKVTKGGFQTQVGSKVIKVNKAYIVDKFGFSPAQKQKVLTKEEEAAEAEAFIAFYESCLLPGVTEKEHKKYSWSVDKKYLKIGQATISTIVQEVFENKTGSKNQLSKLVWDIMFAIHSRDKSFDFAGTVLSEMQKTLDKARIGRNKANKKTWCFRPCPGHCARIQMIMDLEGVIPSSKTALPDKMVVGRKLFIQRRNRLAKEAKSGKSEETAGVSTQAVVQTAGQAEVAVQPKKRKAAASQAAKKVTTQAVSEATSQAEVKVAKVAKAEKLKSLAELEKAAPPSLVAQPTTGRRLKRLMTLKQKERAQRKRAKVTTAQLFSALSGSKQKSLPPTEEVPKTSTQADQPEPTIVQPVFQTPQKKPVNQHIRFESESEKSSDKSSQKESTPTNS